MYICVKIRTEKLGCWDRRIFLSVLLPPPFILLLLLFFIFLYFYLIRGRKKMKEINIVFFKENVKVSLMKDRVSY